MGTVGELQFEVIQYRLEHEYGAKCEFQAKPYSKACWIESENEDKLAEFRRIKAQDIVRDKDGLEVYLAPSQFMLDMEIQIFLKSPSISRANSRRHKKKALDALYLPRRMNSAPFRLAFVAHSPCGWALPRQAKPTACPHKWSRSAAWSSPATRCLLPTARCSGHGTAEAP